LKSSNLSKPLNWSKPPKLGGFWVDEGGAETSSKRLSGVAAVVDALELFFDAISLKILLKVSCSAGVMVERGVPASASVIESAFVSL
jgi:hypothetical protein